MWKAQVTFGRDAPQESNSTETSPANSANDHVEGGLRGRGTQTNTEKYIHGGIDSPSELFMDSNQQDTAAMIDVQSGKVRQQFINLLASPTFAIVMFAVLCVNTTAMGIELYTQEAAETSEMISLHTRLPDVPAGFFVIAEFVFLMFFLTELGARFYVYGWALFLEFFTYIDLLSLLPSLLLILSEAEDAVKVSLEDNIMLHLASLLRLSFMKFGFPHKLAPGLCLRIAALFARASVFLVRQASFSNANQRSFKVIAHKQLSNKVSPLIQVTSFEY